MSAIVRAEDLGLETKRGPVYGPVSFASDTPITVVEGGPGSGKTALLLTLAGRMSPSAGTAWTLGAELPRRQRAVQKRTGIAGFHDIDDLEDTATVAAALAERAAWVGPWWALSRRFHEDDVREALVPVFGEPGAAGAVDLPAGATLIRDLSELQAVLLQIALATLAEPELLVLDRIDRIQADADRAAAWRRLAVLARRGTPCLVSVADARPAELDPLGVAWTAIPTGPAGTPHHAAPDSVTEPVSLESLLEASNK